MTREKYLEIYSKKIAAYIYSKAVMNSLDGNYYVTFKDIETTFYRATTIKNSFSKDEELQESIADELILYEGIWGVDYENDTFSIILCKHYCKLYKEVK